MLRLDIKIYLKRARESLRLKAPAELGISGPDACRDVLVPVPGRQRRTNAVQSAHEFDLLMHPFRRAERIAIPGLGRELCVTESLAVIPDDSRCPMA